MSRSLPLAKHLSHDELIIGYRSCRDFRDRRRWEVLIWYSRGLDVASISARLGLSRPWVRHIIRRYNEQGPTALIDRRTQHPGPPSLLDEGQMQQLKVALEEPVPQELGGGLWNGPKVAAWMSLQLGKSVHRRRGHAYLLLAGYSSQTPRPHHRKSDPVEVEAFKKNCPKP